ncbi:MAG: ABC transporter ATP-binding protein [Dehalococcoidia bacterium]
MAEDTTGSHASSGVVGAHAASEGAPTIEVADLVKQYGKTTALAGLTLTVRRGEVLGFLGPNGAGKTTAVKLLLGLSRPTSGGGAVLGAPLGDRAARARIGYLPELFRYQAWLSAREVLRLHCDLAGIPSTRHAAEIDGALDHVGLVSRADDRVGTFSKGMQQRLGLGVALLGSPDLVFLDEPTSALDPVGRHDVREIIRDLKRRGATVFLNSHLLSEVEQVCDRVAVVDHGRVIASGALDELLRGGQTVRIHMTGLTAAAESQLRAQFGDFDTEGGWYAFQAIAAESVPELVAAAVHLGGRVYRVETRLESLEDRFLQLLGERGGE